MHGSQELGGKERRQARHLGIAQDWAALRISLLAGELEDGESEEQDGRRR